MSTSAPASGNRLETSKSPGISGAIEEYLGGRLRGWIFDPRSPGRVLNLAVAVDGVVIAVMLAAIPREDRDGDGRRGCIGFDAAVDLRSSAGRELRVFLQDQPEDGLSPTILEGDVDGTWGRDALGRATHLFAHVTATHEENARRFQYAVDHITASSEEHVRRIQHVFDHVTASSEENARRIQHVFDHVTATHERILARVQTQPSAPRLADSSFAGIGQFSAQEQPDDFERAVFKARIEKALAAC